MNQRDNDSVDGYLARLPTALPDPEHADTVVGLHLRRRRWRQRLPPALAAAAVLAWLAWGPLTSTDTSMHGEVASHSSAWVELRSADRRLQAAYLVGADDDRLAALWKSRQDAAQLAVDEPRVTRRVRL